MYKPKISPKSGAKTIVELKNGINLAGTIFIILYINMSKSQDFNTHNKARRVN